MAIREILLYYRSHRAETVVLFCQLTVFFLLIGTFFAFTSEAHFGKNAAERAYKDKVIYQLIDGYYEPEEFDAFRAEPNALRILKSYYHALDHADSFCYLAMFDQGIIIEDVDGVFPEERSIDNGCRSKQIDAFQISEQACAYFELQAAEGRGFRQEDFEDRGTVLPVLLGSSYAGTFEVGDRLRAAYYQKKVTLEIIGFLRENTMVYYNGDPEFYLDPYIVLPYVNYEEPDTEFEEWFQKIVYFAMINGYISMPSGSAPARAMLMELEAISEKTGFYNYVFVDSNPNMQQYRGLINILNENYILIISLLTLCFLVNVVTIGFQVYWMQERRLRITAIHHLYGATFPALAGQFVAGVVLLVGFAALAGWTVLVWLKIANAYVLLVFLLTAILLTAGISLFSVFKLKKVDLMQILNQEDDWQ